MTVPVEIVGLFIDKGSGSSIILLGEQNETTHVLPIFIGAAEAQSIAMAMQGLETPRPMTHDLMIDAIGLLGGRLDRVTVTKLEGGTFHADLTIETADELRTLSSRPSDGIALAVRVGAPVHVARSVLDAAAVEVERELDQPFDETEIENIVTEFQEFLATAAPEDFGEPESPGTEEE